MKFIYIFSLSMFCISSGVYSTCEHVDKKTGVIAQIVYTKQDGSKHANNRKCWIIAVPENSYIKLELTALAFPTQDCTEGYIVIKVPGTGQQHVICPQDKSWNNVKAKSNATIEYFSLNNGFSRFQMYFDIERQICESKEHFRCSRHTCISSNQTCDGVKDCEDERDEFDCEFTIEGVRTSRESAIAWLKKQRALGWGANTHRAITALYLSGGVSFEDGNVEGQRMAEQLENETTTALLRDCSSILSVNELSMFINALTVSCHNPREFYGNDLVKILEDRMQTAKSSSPGAYLTLCNANWEFSENRIKRVINILNMHSGYPFEKDIQAMTVMALTCIKNKTITFNKVTYATEMYNATIRNFIASQQSDGSFGNLHTTALVAQALLSCGQEYTKAWNVSATLNYLRKKLNFSPPDFLTTTLVLPVLNNKSLIDVGYRNCNKGKVHVETEINGVVNKLRRKIRVKYSLFIGDDKDVIHCISLGLSQNSSAFDLMTVAAASHPKYKFLMHTDVSGHINVYDVAGVTNDPEAGKFWLLYVGHAESDRTIIHRSISPDKLILNDKEHFIMWYKSTDTTE